MRPSDCCCLCLTAINSSSPAKRPRNQSSEFLNNIRTFFSCFESAPTDLDDLNSCERLQMCRRCISFLEEWHDVNKLISQLQERANRAKSSLTARILQISASDVYKLSNAYNCGKLATKINSVRRRILKEYYCLVALDGKISVGARSAPRKDGPNVNRMKRDPNVLEIPALGGSQNLGEADLKPAVYTDDTIEQDPYDPVPEVNMVDSGDDGEDDEPDHDYIPPEVDMSDSEGEDLNPGVAGKRINNLSTNTQVLDSIDPENSSNVKCTAVSETKRGKRPPKSRHLMAKKVLEESGESSGASDDSESEAETAALKIIDLKAVKVIPPGGKSIHIDDFEIRVVNGKFYCCDCGAMRTLRTWMVDHVRQQHGPPREGDPPQKRPRCLAVTDVGDGRFQRGQIAVESLANGRYQCGVCDKTKKKLSRIVAHIITVHEKLPEKPVLAPRPKKQFFSATKIGPNLYDYQGYKFEFNEELRKYVCSTCGSKSTRHTDLTFHIRSRHINPEAYVPRYKRQSYFDRQRANKGAFMCEECGRTFNSSSNLRTHIIAVHEGKVYTCDLCPNKTFNWPASLYNHQLIHKRNQLVSKAPEFVCETCGKAFVLPSDLTKHRRYHTEGGAECHHCQKTFGSVYTLRRHQKRVHEGSSSSSRKPRKRSKKASSGDEEVDSQEPVVITESDVNVQLEVPVPRGYFWQ